MRFSRIFLFLSPVLALGQNIQISPANPVATAGQTINITTDRPVSVSLQGVGSVSYSGNTITYTAPVGVEANSNVAGCMATPNDSVFHTPISSLPVHPLSSTWVPNTLLEAGLQIEFNWGTNVVDNTTPMAPYTFAYTTALNGVPFPQLPLADRKRETGALTTDDNNDHHIVEVNRQTCTFYETYHDKDFQTPRTAASGYIYASTNYTQPTDGTTDAASLPLAPLMVHLAEIKAGVINHALRFTACTGCVANSYLWPAAYTTGVAGSSAAPMGARFRLKADTDISSYPADAQVVLNALKQYGMILADLGPIGQIQVDTDITEDPQIAEDLATITTHFGASAFEVVDESSLMLDNTLNVVNPNNGYVQPSGQALLTITDLANPKNVRHVPVALAPVTVGMPEPSMVVQAGIYSFPIPYWVNNAQNTSVTWTLGPGAVGSIDANGNYTPPRTLSNPVTFTITAASVQDPNASNVLNVTVIPNGAIRIDAGSPTPTVDENGNTWLADMGFETGSFQVVNDWYPIDAWGDIPLLQQTQTGFYTWGDDIQYRFHIRNGMYLVTMVFGVGACSGTLNPGPYDNGLVIGNLALEVQGNITNWNMLDGIQDLCRTPATVVLPARVTDTNLHINIRATGGYDQHSVPTLQAMTIAHPPQLTINRPVWMLAPGQSVQMTLDNYMGNNPPIWSVLYGAGTITQSGLYTAPASGDSDVVIEVQNPPYAQLGVAQLLVRSSE